MKFRLNPKSPSAQMKQMGKELEPFWVCDIESRNWVEFITIGLTDGRDFWEFGSIKEFFEFLFSHGSVKKTIYAHFGGRFDFLFLLEYVFLESEYIINEMIPRGSGILCFDVKDADGRVLSFRDSSGLLPFGLGSLTENFHVAHKKLEYDFSKIVTGKELTEYLTNDCFGLHEVIEKFRSWPLIRRAGAAHTIASQAMKVFQTFMDEPIYSCTKSVDEFVRAAYFGGRTEIFRPLFTGGRDPLACFDVNSLYPTVMRENSFPVKFQGFTYTYNPDVMGFYDAEVEVPDDMYVPPLGTMWEVNGDKKFIFPTGRFRGRWSTMELEYARSVGVKIISTGQGAIFQNGGMIFKKYIDELYRIREASARDSVDNVLAKLIMNSSYGRFGIITDREQIVVDDGELGVKPFAELGRGDRKVRLMTRPTTLKTFSNVAISAWVTSAARVHMHKLYMKILDRLWYTDTDSMFTTHEFEDVKGLGGLKKEYSCKAACFLLPKTYVADQVEGMGDKIKKVVMKGFDKRKIQNFNFEDFVTALEGDLKRLRATQPEKMATFKTALKKDKVVTLLPESIKEIRSRYDKRIIFKDSRQNYDSRPHKIKDNEPIIFS